MKALEEMNRRLLPELRSETEHPENQANIVRKYLCISVQANGMPVELSNSAVKLKIIDEFLGQFKKVSPVYSRNLIYINKSSENNSASIGEANIKNIESTNDAVIEILMKE